jgi:hypothetical protein
MSRSSFPVGLLGGNTPGRSGQEQRRRQILPSKRSPAAVQAGARVPTTTIACNPLEITPNSFLESHEIVAPLEGCIHLVFGHRSGSGRCGLSVSRCVQHCPPINLFERLPATVRTRRCGAERLSITWVMSAGSVFNIIVRSSQGDMFLV